MCCTLLVCQIWLPHKHNYVCCFSLHLPTYSSTVFSKTLGWLRAPSSLHTHDSTNSLWLFPKYLFHGHLLNQHSEWALFRVSMWRTVTILTYTVRGCALVWWLRGRRIAGTRIHTSTYIYTNIHKFGTNQLCHSVSVSTLFTQPRDSGPWCVNHMETSNSYNLYVEFLSVTKASWTFKCRYTAVICIQK